jgi:hypothetical protein
MPQCEPDGSRGFLKGSAACERCWLVMVSFCRKLGSPRFPRAKLRFFLPGTNTHSKTYSSVSSKILLASAVWRLAFGVWRLAVGVWRLAFGVRRSAFGVRRSAFGVRLACVDSLSSATPT